MIDWPAEDQLRRAAGWTPVRAVDVGECDHCPGVVWERVDKAFMCLACGCLMDRHGRYSLCKDRRPA